MATATDPAAARKEQQAADLARAQDAGWNNPVPFQYETVVGGTPAEDETRDTAVWLSDAAIYQWDDEFGDVGEPNPELEKMLFDDQYLQRAGGAIKALSFDITLEGPTKISPVRNVSHTNIDLCVFVDASANLSSSRMLVFTLSCSTAAFLLPILSKLMGKARQLAAPRPNPVRYNPLTDKVRAEPLVLIVCPTRELACQIFDEVRDIS